MVDLPWASGRPGHRDAILGVTTWRLGSPAYFTWTWDWSGSSKERRRPLLRCWWQRLPLARRLGRNAGKIYWWKPKQTRSPAPVRRKWSGRLYCSPVRIDIHSLPPRQYKRDVFKYWTWLEVWSRLHPAGVEAFAISMEVRAVTILFTIPILDIAFYIFCNWTSSSSPLPFSFWCLFFFSELVDDARAACSKPKPETRKKKCHPNHDVWMKQSRFVDRFI